MARDTLPAVVSAESVFEYGMPASGLVLTFETGDVGRAYSDCREAIWEQGGLVYLSGMEEYLKERTVRIVDTDPMSDVTETLDVRLGPGFTDDPVVVELFRRFMASIEDGTIQYGPLEVPTADGEAKGSGWRKVPRRSDGTFGTGEG